MTKTKTEIHDYLKSEAQRRGITFARLCHEIGVHKTGWSSNPAIVKINAFLGTDFPVQPPRLFGFTLPDWVSSAPREIRAYVEQEYYIDTERARFIAENARTYEDVQALRREAYNAERKLTGTYR